MFRNLRLRQQPEKVVPDAKSISAEQLERDATLPITLRQINDLPDNAQKRIYRALLPPGLLARFKIDPITWKGSDGTELVSLKTSDAGKVNISIGAAREPHDEYMVIGLADNSFNGVDLEMLVLNDPDGQRFRTDYDEDGQPTMFGTLRRNLAEEARAMRAGLAPGQVRMGLGGSRLVLDHLDNFLATLGHRAYFLEPLTYVSAWIFERRGFAYVRGHKLMDDINTEFQPGGRFFQALDGSTPFRQPDQWRTVRGRAWAIQDGVLQSIDAHWDGLRMVKQVGRHAGLETFPNAVY
ncbi:MAG TPA: hypothetical protein VE136_13555 [Anaerolineales bacterium]|nr:hypothetical protein [Anaerolineales bacterium]